VIGRSAGPAARWLLALVAAGWQLGPDSGRAIAQARAAGTVVRVAGRDTIAVGSVPVVLHRIGPAVQGPLDTVGADRRGRFAVRYAPDSGAAFLLSVRYLGIEYFSAPLGSDPARPDTSLVLIVADTSSTTPVRLAERTLLIGSPDESGSRTVIDWLVLENPGELTRAPGDTLRPAWALALPPEGQNVELADVHLSQFSPDALGFRRDSVMVLAPIPPGRKELVLQYRLPRGEPRLTVPGHVNDSVFVLLEEPEARVTRPPLARAGAQAVENRTFYRWAGTLDGASELEILFPSAGVAPGTLLALLVGITLIGFASLAVIRLRSRRLAELPQFSPSPNPEPIAIADSIARLDHRHLDSGGVANAEERSRYEAERARLKAELARALASRPPRS